VATGQRVAALFGDAADATDGVDVYAVLADSRRALLRVGKTRLEADTFPSLTRDCPQLHLFERELAEQYGIRPAGHGWFKPVRFHASYRPGKDAWDRRPGEAPVIGVADFYRIEGVEIHEVGRRPGCTLASSSRGIFAFNATGNRFFIWRSRSATSTAAPS